MADIERVRPSNDQQEERESQIIDAEFVYNTLGINPDQIRRVQELGFDLYTLSLSTCYSSYFLKPEDIIHNMNKPSAELLGKQNIEVKDISVEDYLLLVRWMQIQERTDIYNNDPGYVPGVSGHFPEYPWLQDVDLDGEVIEFTGINGDQIEIVNGEVRVTKFQEKYIFDEEASEVKKKKNFKI
jgi:hypothetical protein